MRHIFARLPFRTVHNVEHRTAFRSFCGGSPSLRMASTLPRLPVFERLVQHDPASTAVVHSLSQRTFTYGQLVRDVAKATEKLHEDANGRKLAGERIAFLIENSYDYVVTLLAALAAHSIAVPLSPAFPDSELRYVLNQSGSSLLLSSPRYAAKAKAILREGLEQETSSILVEKRVSEDPQPASVTLEAAESSDGGLMLYTSGTTSRPKGVLLPSSALTAQCLSLLEAWKYSTEDHLLHCLPLHHIHGTVNALLAPLFAGSAIEMMFPFTPDAVWRRLGAPFLGESHTLQLPVNLRSLRTVTFFTVVPTIYNRLLATHTNLSPELQTATRTAISPTNLRLNISGSAALPTPTKAAWTELSGGNVLLERYGMTEVGMALSCGLALADRVDASVGWPLPLVEARLVDTETGAVIRDGEELDADGRERLGEVHLRGPTIFREYWRNPAATASEFADADDGGAQWFKTGDVAVRRGVEGAGRGESGAWATGKAYFIQGRKSADIIKTGGEKVSALEVERELLSLPEVDECAVVGLPSEQWGQKVAAVVVLSGRGATAGKGGKPWGPMDMRRALRDKLANYKIPQELRVVDGIPRNAMGKINKKQLVAGLLQDK